MGEHVALFVDFENIYKSVKNALDRYVEWQRIVGKVRELGPLAVQRAYANWSAYDEAQIFLLEAGFELIHVPEYREGKGSDARMLIDAVTLGLQDPIGTVVLVTGDSDFVEAVYYLRNRGRRVVVLGVQATTSPILIQAAHRFIAYEALIRERPPAAKESAVFRLPSLAPEEREKLVEEYLNALSRRVRMTPHPKRPEALLDFYNFLVKYQGRESYKAVSTRFQQDPAMKAKYDDTILGELRHQVFHAYALHFEPPRGAEEGLWDRLYRLRPEIKSRRDFLDWCDVGLTLWLAKNLGVDVDSLHPEALAVLLYGQVSPPLVKRAGAVLAKAREFPQWPPQNNSGSAR